MSASRNGAASLMVARYADACNLFGDLQTIRRKLDALDRHCAAVDRDPATITKTRLASLVIAETVELAERKARAIARARGIDYQRYRFHLLAGDRDAVREQVGAYLDAGLDGLVFNVADAHDLDPVSLAGEVLTEAFAPSRSPAQRRSAPAP